MTPIHRCEFCGWPIGGLEPVRDFADAEAYLGQGAGNVNDLELGAALNFVSHYIYMLVWHALVGIVAAV